VAESGGVPAAGSPAVQAALQSGNARLRLQVMAGHRAAQLRQGARAIGAAVAGAGAALGVEPAWPPSTPQRRRR
jgi:hypothetical protein